MERPQPRSGEDERSGYETSRRQTGLLPKSAGGLPGARQGWCALGAMASGAHLSIASCREDQVGSEGLRFGGASQGRAVYAARAVVVAPAGAKGLLVVSMCQIASVSLRAMSTRATEAPRWRPSRVLVRW
jgi:hypothetical protein